MAIIQVPVGKPYGMIAVNTFSLYVEVPHQAAPDSSCDLLIDTSGSRSILALEPVAMIGGKLGADFVEFSLASTHPGRCFVSRRS
jgi:hypothetical protein